MITKFVALILAVCGIYTQSGTVTEIDRRADVVMVETTDGNLWEFSGVEDWMEGDGVELTMHDSGTENPEDDVILRTIYKG